MTIVFFSASFRPFALCHVFLDTVVLICLRAISLKRDFCYIFRVLLVVQSL